MKKSKKSDKPNFKDLDPWDYDALAKEMLKDPIVRAAYEKNERERLLRNKKVK